MKYFSLLFIVTCIASCDNSKPVDVSTKYKMEIKEKSIYDRLNSYFSLHQITPTVIINNTAIIQTNIDLLNNRIKWIDSEAETKLQINDDLFSLKNQLTINPVHDDHQDNVDFANNWEQIKLYNINDREIITISMHFYPCTGIGCGVYYFLIYDTKTKSKNFFGSFYTDNDLELYNINLPLNIDYISKTFVGDAQGTTPIDLIYELYSMNNDGLFVKQKNKSGETYQIIHKTFPNDSTKLEQLEQNWITEIK